METIDVADLGLPDGWFCFAYPGWRLLYGEADRDKVPLLDFAGTAYRMPARFDLVVKIPTDGEAIRIALLFEMSGDASRLNFAGALGLDGDLDIALERLKRLHTIDWWKLKAVDQLNVDMHNEVMAKFYDQVRSGGDADSETTAQARHIFSERRAQGLSLPVSRRRNRVTPADLDKVAAAYIQAKSNDQPTTRAVANALSVSPSRAAHLVVEARKLGKIPPK